VNKPQAEELAIQALTWMAEDPEVIGGFMGTAGADASDLASRAKDPDFLGFVLDYLLTNDEMIMNFANWSNCSPDAPMRARAMLPGGDLPNWT